MHEYVEIKRYGGVIIKVTNDSVEKNDSHISEQEYNTIPFDYEIDNTLQDMKTLITTIDLLPIIRKQ